MSPHPHRRALVALALGLVSPWAHTAAYPPRASAQAPDARASLTWSAPETCIEAEALQVAVNDRLDRDAFGEDPVIHIDGRVVPREGGGFRAALELRTDDETVVGSRELVSRSRRCRDLDGSLALVIALLVEHAREHVRLEVPPLPEPAVAPPPAPESEPPVEPPPPPAPEPRGPTWVATVATGASAAIGYLPGLAGSVRLGIGVRAPSWIAFELEGAWWPGSEARRADVAADVALWAGALTVCLRPRAGARWELSGCGSVWAGRTRARATGLDAPGEADAFVAHATTEVRVSRTLSESLALRGELGLILPLRGQRYTYDDALGERQELHALGVGLEAGLVLEARLQ